MVDNTPAFGILHSDFEKIFKERVVSMIEISIWLKVFLNRIRDSFDFQVLYFGHQ
jgi:hypothetical protein